MSDSSTPLSTAVSMMEHTNPQSSLAPDTSTTNALRERSCVLCKQRKVKCDRKHPCFNCSKALVECVFRAPAPPRRRKKKDSEVSLVARLKHYEELLKDYGAKADVSDIGGVDDGPSSGHMQVANSIRNTTGTSAVIHDHDRKATQQHCGGAEDGKMIAGNGRSRYLESNLWTTLSDEFRDPKEMLQESSDDEQDKTTTQATNSIFQPDGGSLVLGLRPTTNSLRSFHPPPVHIFKLWQTFLDNINPLCKIVHAPSLQQKLIEAVGDLDNVSKATNALMFGVYFSAVSSLTEADCPSLLGDTKLSLLTRYHLGAQQALIEARFLQCSDLAVLQAFVLYLLAVRQFSDPRSLWTLVGLSVRIGQRMGLHRNGETLGLSLFETEIRRRVWWQIAQLDGMSGELSGSKFSRYTLFDSMTVPLNVNDSDLNPAMRELPVEHVGATEMMFCGVRYHIGKFHMGEFMSSSLANVQQGSAADVAWQIPSIAAAPFSDREGAIEELEKLLEDNYLRYCDPVLPLHLLSIIMARSAILVLWLRARHPRQSPDKGASMTEEERETLFAKSLKYLEYESIGHSSQIARRFLWHTSNHFQWHAFIYALSELRRRTVGEGVDKAWQLVSEVYRYHPEMLSEGKSSLYRAVGNLAIKAWEVRETEYVRRYGCLPSGGAPPFISALRLQRRAGKVVPPPDTTLTPLAPVDYAKADQQAVDHSQSVGSVQYDYSGEYELPAAAETWMDDASPMDWTVWDDLLQDFELQPLDSNGKQPFGQL